MQMQAFFLSTPSCFSHGAHMYNRQSKDTEHSQERNDLENMNYYPEGYLLDTPENQSAIQTPTGLSEALREGKILEARAMICDSTHNLIVDLHGIKGIIPREEGAIGIREGTVPGYCHDFPCKPSGFFCGNGAS